MVRQCGELWLWNKDEGGVLKCRVFKIKITSWNCRGLFNSKLYVESLVEGGSDILFLSETWLWPYEMNRLSELCEGFESFGKADKRLCESSEGGRGYGGIGFLWRKSVGATPISGIKSDRIGGVKFSVGNGDDTVVSVIGVYLPCLDQGVRDYRECLVQLEHVVCESGILHGSSCCGRF